MEPQDVRLYLKYVTGTEHLSSFGKILRRATVHACTVLRKEIENKNKCAQLPPVVFNDPTVIIRGQVQPSLTPPCRVT